jgi:hypothetical protein
MEARLATMPRYAVVTIVAAPRPEDAWESIRGQLLHDDVDDSIAYVGAPWLVPGDLDGDPTEFETDGIQLRLNGKRVSLGPAD